MTKTDVIKVLKGEYICKGTLSCPFTPDWLNRCEFERHLSRKQTRIATLEKVIKEFENPDGDAYKFVKQQLKEAKGDG